MGAGPVRIQYIDRLAPLLLKKKRFKVLVGGRASTKTTFVGDHCVAQVAQGKTWCCAREYMNSIDESVHSLLRDEIERLGIPGFEVQRTAIQHQSGGHTFYRGLARNITSLKGIICDVLWIEEAEALSEDTLRVLTASIRASALDQDRASADGSDVDEKEIWLTMNRGSSKDPVSKRFLERAEEELERCGYYEDDLMIVIEVNYDENPWFLGSGLEQERLDDKKHLSASAYDHKWHGAYSDTVENAIIEPDWFDACIDAHLKLGFKPEGLEVVAHDPFDDGDDAAAIAHRHGSVIVHADELTKGKVNEVCDWSLEYTQQTKPDAYIWDSVGVGAGLKRQIDDALGDKKIDVYMFNGQARIDRPDAIYQPTHGTTIRARTNAQMFFNRRAQRYWNLRDRVFMTYLAITENKYTDPGQLISFSSEIPVLKKLRAEICRIPRKPNGQGKIQIMSKEEMAKENIDSPNIVDCIMMSLDVDGPKTKPTKINYQGW